MRRSAWALSFCAAVLMAAPARSKGIELDSREYKQMLRPEKFANDPARAVADFWKDFVGVIQGNNLEAKDKPALKEQRSVKFFDTSDCLLDRSGFALRIRADAGSAATKKITLKLRSPDVVLVSAIELEGLDENDPDPKFEEDVTSFRAAGATSAEPFLPRRSRSLFSRSTTQKVEGTPKKLSDVRDLYPNFKKTLEQLANVDWNGSLDGGQTFLEHVYEGAVADLGKKADAGVSVTLWYAEGASAQAPTAARPEVAEVSFKYKVGRPEEPFKAALGADRLFASMQAKLAGWIDPTATNVARPSGEMLGELSRCYSHVSHIWRTGPVIRAMRAGVDIWGTTRRSCVHAVGLGGAVSRGQTQPCHARQPADTVAAPRFRSLG